MENNNYVTSEEPKELHIGDKWILENDNGQMEIRTYTEQDWELVNII